MQASTGRASAPTQVTAHPHSQPLDAQASFRQAAIQGLAGTGEFWDSMAREGLWWWRIAQLIQRFAPDADIVGDQFKWAQELVKTALVELVGTQDVAWVTESRQRADGKINAWVKPLRPVRRPGPPTPPDPEEPPF